MMVIFLTGKAQGCTCTCTTSMYHSQQQSTFKNAGSLAGHTEVVLSCTAKAFYAH